MARSQMSAKKSGDFDPGRLYVLTESEWASTFSTHNLLRHLIGTPLGVNVDGFYGSLPEVEKWRHPTSRELGKLLLRAVSEGVHDNYVLRRTQDWILGVRYGRYNRARETLEQMLFDATGDWKTTTLRTKKAKCVAIRDLYPYDPRDLTDDPLHIPHSKDVVALLGAMKKSHSDTDVHCNRCDENGLCYRMQTTQEFRKPASEVLMAFRCVMCKGTKQVQYLAPSLFDSMIIRILADACEESGTDTRIVRHLRDTRDHYLGCWAIRELGKATKAWILEC